MDPMFDSSMLAVAVIVSLAMVFVVVNLISSILDEMLKMSPEFIIEQISGYLTLSTYAPDIFYINDSLPNVGHAIKIQADIPRSFYYYIENDEYEPILEIIQKNQLSTKPPLIYIEVAKLTGTQQIEFKQPAPISFTYLNSMNITGDCINSYCMFEVYDEKKKKEEKIEKKDYNDISISKLNNTIKISFNKKPDIIHEKYTRYNT